MATQILALTIHHDTNLTLTKPQFATNTIKEQFSHSKYVLNNVH